MSRLLLALVALAICQPLRAQAPAKAGGIVLSEAQKAGVPAKIGTWTLVRHVSGEHGHFLFAHADRTFSLFITETKSNRPLQPQQGWKTLLLASGQPAYLHKDSRNPERTALIFKHLTQRRLVMGRLTEAELLSLAKQLR